MKIEVEIRTVSGAGYRAECPSLPGCTVFGRSPDEARERASRAILGYLASLDVAPPERLELDVPEPSRDGLRRRPTRVRLSGAA